MSNIAKRPNGQWRARYRDESGKEHARHFARKVDAQRWLDEVTTSIVTGAYVDPKTARMTVDAWSTEWLKGYASRRKSSVRQAEVHVKRIKAEFGSVPLSSVKPSHVRAWTSKLAEDGLEPSYIYALHARLSQLMADAVHDGVLTRSPCSRRTSPGGAVQRTFVPTTEQVWQLHDLFPERHRPAVLLGAFAGLRVAEVCGLRVADVDFMRGIIRPMVQYPAEPLKSDTSRSPIPIPEGMVHVLAEHVRKYPGATLLTTETGGQVGPWTLQRYVRAKRGSLYGKPEELRFHDLRHYFASLLIAHGADVKVVQARLRHTSATTTLNTYAHLWPDADDRTRAVVQDVFSARAVGTAADSLRTAGGSD